MIVMQSVTADAAEVPEGKNWLNPEHVTAQEADDVMFTHTSIPLLGNETYTMTTTTNYFHYLEIMLDGEIIIEGDPSNETICETSGHQISCTFTTNGAQDFDFALYDNAYQYYHHFGLDNIILERGDVFTGYEDYIDSASDDPENSDDASDPVIDGAGSYTIAYDDATPLTSIVEENVGAYDEVDGDISDAIVIEEDGYTPNQGTVGSYDVLLSVTDSSGNTAYFSLTINVINAATPQIEGPEEIAIDVEETQTIESIIDKHFAFTDDYDGVLETYEIISDAYTESSMSVGTYPVSLRTTNSGGITQDATFNIVLIDTTPPVLSGPEVKEISYTETFDPQAFISRMSISDNHDKSIANDAISVQSSTYQPEAVGRYTIIFKATDSSGNVGTHELTLDVIDDVAPLFSVADTIEITAGSVLSQNDLFERLNQLEDVSAFNPTSMVVLEDDYTRSLGKEGAYHYRVALENAEGERMEKTTSINVTPQQNTTMGPTIGIIITGSIVTLGIIRYRRKH